MSETLNIRGVDKATEANARLDYLLELLLFQKAQVRSTEDRINREIERQAGR